MNAKANLTPEAVVAEGLHELRKDWGWFFGLGIGLILAGTAAIVLPIVATLGVVTVFGVLLLMSGVIQAIGAFYSPRWQGVLLHLLMGILYGVVGFLILENPLEGAVGLTLLAAVFLITGGIMRVVVSLQLRFPNWGWSLLNGAVTLLLGILVWKQLPEAALWVIGLFVGIEMIFNGWSWVMLSLLARRPVSESASPSE